MHINLKNQRSYMPLRKKQSSIPSRPATYKNFKHFFFGFLISVFFSYILLNFINIDNLLNDQFWDFKE